MTIQEARDMVVQKMQPVVEHPLILGCPARLDDASTEEYDWGWLFVFVPTGQELCQRVDQRAKYALDRVTGIATPVGNKGQGKRVISPCPPRTNSQKAISHPTKSRLFFIPIFSVLLALSMFKVSRLMMAKLASGASVSLVDSARRKELAM